jgi:Fur family ferric uptake transcriptional regulator
MVCVKCGSVAEFFDKRIEAQQEKVAHDHGFVIQDHSLTLYGTCKRCSDT